MADVEFSEEIRDRILYHWSELGDRPKIIWTRLQEEGFNVDLNTVQALMQCEDEEGGGTIAEHESEDSRNDGASVSPYPEGNSPASTESPTGVRSHSRRGKNRESKIIAPQNRRTKLTPDVLNLIEKILDTDGNIYSLAALQSALLIKGVKISKTTTFRALEKLGRSIVVKKMNFANRVDMAPVPESLRKNPHFASRMRAATYTPESKRRQHTLTIREMESLGSQSHLDKDHHGAVPMTTASTSTSTSVSTAAEPGGTRMETGESPGPVLVLPPKKAATATSSSLKLVLGQGGVTSYTSAPLDEETVNDQGRDGDGAKRQEEMETQESVRSQSPAERPMPTVKKEVVDDDYEIKVDDDYELNVDEDELSDKRYAERPASEERPEDLVIRRSGPRRRDRMPAAMSWIERTHDNDDEAAIIEARAISQRRLSHPRDQSMMGSDEEFESDPETVVNLKRPSSLGRSSVGSVHSTHSAHSGGSRSTHSSLGYPKNPEDMAKSGRSSSTLTSQSGSSGGSGGMERNRRSPVTSSATAAAMAAASMRHFPLTFHRSQMCNAAAMASRLAHGISPEMGAPFHVGQRRLPLSAGRGGVKQPFMSKFQRNMIGMRQAMRMQRMAPGFPHAGISFHRYQKMLRMQHAMGKAMRGMHHFGRGRGRGRFHGDLPERHMRNMRFNEAHETTSPHSPGHFSGDEISPELEIDPPETYGEFAERIFSNNRNQRQTESTTAESNGTEKWMEDISHRLEVIESQLQLILEHLPFMGGAEMQSVSSDPGGAGSEVDSGLQEDSGAGPGGAGDDRSGGGDGESGEGGGGGGGGSGHGDRTSERGEGGAGTGGGGATPGETGETEERTGRKHTENGGSAAGSTSRDTGSTSRDASVPSGRDRDKGRHLATERRHAGAKENGARRGDTRVGFRTAPGGVSRLTGAEGRQGQERPMEDDSVIMLDDKTDDGRFSDNLSEFGDVRGGNQSQTDVRVQMVMQDSRWDEMTPYAGAPRLAIALARYCIFGTKILIRSSVTGRNSKHPLDFAGMRKIKHLLYQKYGSRCSPIEFEVIWKTSRESISQLCKRLRRKYNAAGMAQAGHDDLMGMDDFMVDCPLLT